MAAQYIDCEGSFVTKDEISSAFHDGRAVLVHWYGDGFTGSALALDGRGFDTRGDSYSVWDAAWTSKPKSVRQCLAVARVNG